jgi:hypothetical protein
MSNPGAGSAYMQTVGMSQRGFIPQSGRRNDVATITCVTADT